MEKIDKELLFQIAPTNHELQKLYQEHLRLEERLKELEGRSVYTTADALEIRQLKKEKLHGMDAIMAILYSYRQQDVFVVNQ